MSYVFDKTMSVWGRHVRPLVVKDGKEMLALYFESVLESFHDANHRLKDAVNHDAEVNRAIRELDEVAKEFETGTAPDSSEKCVACRTAYAAPLAAPITNGVAIRARLCPACGNDLRTVVEAFFAALGKPEDSGRGA